MNKDVFRKLRQMLMEELDLSRELSDKEILDVIDELILNQIKDVRLALKEKVQLRQELFYSVRKLDVLQELVDDETVTEIMVNGPDTIFVERAGKLMKWHKSFTSAEKLEDVIQQIVGKCNRVINESMPIVDARLENGSRVNAVIYPVALNGPILTIRRFPEHPITMEKLIALGSITQECAEFLEKLVKARYSMVIGGGTGSGKTTLLNILSGKEGYDEGKITFRRDLRVGYLEQSPNYPEDLTVLEACFYHGNSTVELIKEYERCMETPGNPGLEDLLGRMEHEKAWDYERRAKQILSQLKIRDFGQKIKHLSGGQLKRVALANVLITEPDLLILDEPTNHLDLESITALNEGLTEYKGTLLFDSHDHQFVQTIADRIIEILPGGIIDRQMTYDEYIEDESIDAIREKLS